MNILTDLSWLSVDYLQTHGIKIANLNSREPQMFTIKIGSEFTETTENTKKSFTTRTIKSTQRMTESGAEFEPKRPNPHGLETTAESRGLIDEPRLRQLVESLSAALAHQRVAVVASSRAKQRVVRAFQVPRFVLVEELESFDALLFLVTDVVFVEFARS